MNWPTPVKMVFAVFFLSLAFWAVRFYHQLPAVTDVFLYTYPSQTVNQMEFQKGNLPLWDAFTGCGTPQLANSLSACFYPPFWLWNWTGLSHWIVWMSLFHSLFSFIGFYLWGRAQKIQSLWAALVAFSFAGSLHMVRCWGYPIFSASQSWTPWVFLTATLFLEEGKLRWWAALVFSVGFQILAGYPFFSFYTLVFLGVWILLQKADWKRKRELVLAVPGALALTAAHWLPFLDLLHFSTRGSWGSPDQFPYFSKAVEYLTLLSPTLLGKAEAGSYLGQTANASFMMYFGLVPFLAWSVGGLSQDFPGRFPYETGTPKSRASVGDFGPRGRRFWGFSALAWLFWMMGFHFPLWRVLPEGWLESLNPSKAIGVFTFAACTCAGLALTRFFRDRGEEGKQLKIAWILSVLWTADLLSVPFRVVHPVPDPFLKPEIQTWARRAAEAASGERLLSLHAKNQVDLVGNQTDSQALETGADQWVKNLLTNSNTVWGIRTPQAYLSIWTDSMDKLWKAFNRAGNYDTALPDLAGVRALYFPIGLSAPHYEVLEKGSGYLLRNTSCLPDAWPAVEEKVFQNQDEVLAELLREKDGIEARKVVLFEKDIWLSPASRPLNPQNNNGQPGWVRPAGGRYSYQGSFTGPGCLFWDETFTPGWKAWVDGSPAPIQRADAFFMAVPLAGGGNHRVDFRYEPVSFRLGLFLSLISLVLGGLAAGLRRGWIVREAEPG